VALAPQLPRTLQGSAPALAMNSIGQFGIRAGRDTDAVSSTFESEYASAADSLLHPAGREAFDAVKMLKQANPESYTPGNGAEYPNSGFGAAMRQIAQLIKSDLGLEVAFTELGNWDHHVNEGST